MANVQKVQPVLLPQSIEMPDWSLGNAQTSMHSLTPTRLKRLTQIPVFLPAQSRQVTGSAVKQEQRHGLNSKEIDFCPQCWWGQGFAIAQLSISALQSDGLNQEGMEVQLGANLYLKVLIVVQEDLRLQR
ncbi:hypothetical protein Baya_4420 [Bagarius yarrelli]|uniref:Uncharacterized protein n=1 Tax=Bagarius yarrelli TaxID=175774 RepID=A0A556TQ29_BAGYA|nr:hypothetical protein Baya_4420 [Bagarius yarrelli]